MTIGIDASRANKIQKTGVEWYSYYLIEELKKIDRQNRYILYSDKPLQGELAKLPPNWKSRVLKWLPKFLWTQIRLSWEMFIAKHQAKNNNCFSRVVPRSSCEISSSSYTFQKRHRTPQDDRRGVDLLFVPAHAIPIIHPKRVITTIHDLGFERFPEIYSWWQRFYLRWSTKFALKHAEKIIVPSEFTKRELVDLYSVAASAATRKSDKPWMKTVLSKIKVIHHGYDEKNYRVIENLDLRFKMKDLRIKNQKFILYIGRLEKKKNISNLIRAFKILRTKYQLPIINSQLLVLIGQPGYGYDEIKKELKTPGQGLRGYPIKKDIIELGWINQKYLPYFLNKASLVILPSFYEGFGLPIIEAMACGTPVIASQTGSLSEIAGGAALLIDPNRPEEMAKAMRRVLEDEKLREKLRVKGLKRVKDFSWAKCARETLELLH